MKNSSSLSKIKTQNSHGADNLRSEGQLCADLFPKSISIGYSFPDFLKVGTGLLSKLDSMISRVFSAFAIL